MPPRSSLTGSFSVSDANNEVVCPLRNHDGSSCRKRCLGEKRYRSMQEHIRRAHPEHYISKLPATEESFLLMVNTPPHERPAPPPPPQNSVPAPNNYSRDPDRYYSEDPGQNSQRSSDEYRRGSILPAASAAAALAQLHNHRPDYDWDSEQEAYSEAENPNHKQRARFAPTTFEPRPLDEKYPIPNNSRPRELLPSSLARSPPGRSSTLPPAPRSVKPNRPRKSSVTQNARKGKHERTKSKEHARRMSHDRKAFSAEPQAAAAAMLGKRWEDLIDAAASATEEDSRDLTPVPSSPHMANRASLPPYLASQFQSYHASPLQKTLTPPPPETTDLQPFPSVESSGESGMSGASGYSGHSGHSGANFHMTPHGLSDSSPQQHPQAVQQPTIQHGSYQPVQIYCAMCRRLSVLKDSYACPECICGLCQECVDVLVSEQTSRGRIARCPKCGVVGGKFKPFQLDIR